MQPADRTFYSLPKPSIKLDEKGEDDHLKDQKLRLLDTIRNSVIGKDKVFAGPFGLREVTYLDYIASGRALSFIEDYIRREVLPEYGNTHTTTSITSLQTTLYRHEARDIIRNAVNASEHDSVIFVGSGCTAAVHKLIHALNLKQAPVVFVGPYEHHSNLLPWKECGAQVVRINQTKSGLVDVVDLEKKLKKWQAKGRQLIGSFSAASNITGIVVDVDHITICLHKHGALAFWDYATAGPYVRIDMNPVLAGGDQSYVYKDAVFISPHKFVGGTSTPGVLVAKKSLFRHVVPEGGGGGSIFYVRRDSHRYLQEPELREEGGTPAIVESIRAGLVFQLKEAVTPEVIMTRETELCRKAMAALSSCENLVILGNTDVPRLPVFSFLVYHPATGRFLHHNFLSAILNDVFGIQARGGCACAGPYAMDLLGLDEKMAEKIESFLVEDSRLDRTHLRRYREYSHREIIRPGFTRLNLPFFMDDECLQFVIEAVKMVALHGWKLLPQYIFNPETGEWRQKNFQVFKDRKWLGHISYSSGEMKYKLPPPVVKGPLPDNYEDCLNKARQVFEQAEKIRVKLPDQTLSFDEQSRSLRWFTLPSEALDCIHGNSHSAALPSDLPFLPPQLKIQFGLMDSDSADDNDIGDSISKNDDVIEHNFENGVDVPDFSDGMMSCLEKGFANIGMGEHSDTEKANDTLLCKKSENSVTAFEADLTSATTDDVCLSNKVSSNSSENFSTSKSSYTNGDKSDTIFSNQDKTNCFVNESVGGRTVNCEKDKDNVLQTENCDTRNVEKPPNVSLHLENNDPVNNKTKESSPKDDNLVENADKESTMVCKLPSASIATQPQKTETALTGMSKWFSPPKSIFKPTVKALEEFEMIQDGDRLLVCLSGGKDSLSLLHTVRQYQFFARSKGIRFEFGAVTVDPQTPAYDPSPLKHYLKLLGVPYFYESQCILETAENLPDGCASICSFCSRMKRGRIYAAARREGYNVLALGQHLDDLSESFLMSFFHNGTIRTMKAHYTVKEGDLRVIRPFVYAREKDLRNFAEKSKLPVIAENCPACFEAPKERHRTKQLLASQELLFPHLYNSIMAALRPVMAINKTGVNFAKLVAGKDKDDDDDEENDIDDL